MVLQSDKLIIRQSYIIVCYVYDAYDIYVNQETHALPIKSIQ